MADKLNSAMMQKYAYYEAAKQVWIRTNPEATPEQYEAAMRAIAKKYRV